MLRKLLATAPISLSVLSVSWATVDVNTADCTGLKALSGIDPKRFKLIIEERTKNGPYRDAADFKVRVSDIGDKTLIKPENGGLTLDVPTPAPTTKRDGKDARKK